MAALSYIPRILSLSKNVNIDIKDVDSQHVINGARFIYNQYVKRKPGVILNDPADYDLETQVALFLNATHNGPHQYFKTVLIICDEHKLLRWNFYLKKWMPDCDEIAIDWVRPTTKKSLYVVTTDRLNVYCRREWDMLVVDDDSFVDFNLKPAEFKVGYKIFLTADDLKENLRKFSLIYRWLYPDKDINIDELRPNKNSISDILQKRIWFGAFAADILVRNAGSQTAPNNYTEVSKDLEPRRITRKNKDATGTKIKRSRRKIEEDNTDTAIKKILVLVPVPSDHKDGNGINACDSKINDDNDPSKLDVETFIRDQEPLKMEEFIDISDIDENMCETSAEVDVIEAKTYDGSDSEASNRMELNYSEDTVNSDDAYCLETQDNGVYNDNLLYKENTDENIEENDAINTNTHIEEKDAFNTDIINIKENKADANVDMEKSEDDLALCTEVENGLIDGNPDSVVPHTEQEIESKEKDNIDVKEDAKKLSKADDLDSKWEEMALKKFKGSFLDRIF